MSLALARKYRPASFEDLIGQEAVSRTLSQALTSDRLSHAYLFSGLRGSGKTSTARIFARALLCERGASAHPCGVCASCTMAAENRHIDIIEMDAASNRGIEDIKDLIEHTKYKPSVARYKIFIIDEVHMLTTQAFNALLKTLEEPPAFVKFILATTDPLKLPATILSRTQHFRFNKIPHKLVTRHLEHILNKEGVEFEKEAIEIIARSGAGSLRDSLTLLDQAIVYSHGLVDIGTVTNMLGIIEPSMLERLLDTLLQRDQAGILEFVSKASAFETEMVLDEFTLYLKDLLLSRSPKVPPLIMERFFRILADSKSLLALGGDGEFILALTLFKMVEALEIKEIDAMIKTLEKELEGVGAAAPLTPAPAATAAVRVQEPARPAAPVETAAEEYPVTEEHTPPAPAPQEETPPETPQPPEESRSDTLSRQAFGKLVARIYDRDYKLGSVFEKSITFASFEDHTLTWESTAQGDDKKELINNWSLIRMFVQDIFGFDTKIVNVAKEPAPEVPSQEPETPDAPVRNEPLPQQEPEPEPTVFMSDDYPDTSSMIEEVEMPSSCISPDIPENEAAKEKDPSQILEEPMIKEVLELFAPKKVRIQKKS